MIRYGGEVSCLGIKHVRYDQHDSGPGHVVAEIAPEVGRQVRQRTVRFLRPFQVVEQLTVELRIVEHEILSQGGYSPVAQPRLLFVALRTIHGHSLVVARNAPPGIAVDPVEQLVRGFETAYRTHIVGDHAGREIGRVALSGITGDFDESETVVRKSRFVGFSFAAPQGVQPFGFGAPEVGRE